MRFIFQGVVLDPIQMPGPGLSSELKATLSRAIRRCFLVRAFQSRSEISDERYGRLLAEWAGGERVNVVQIVQGVQAVQAVKKDLMRVLPSFGKLPRFRQRWINRR